MTLEDMKKRINTLNLAALQRPLTRTELLEVFRIVIHLMDNYKIHDDSE